MNRTRLPLELIDAIFENLHDDNRTLAACSLVCKAWVHSARRYLFADAVLDRASTQMLLNSKTAAMPFVRRMHLKGEFNLQFWSKTFLLLVSFERLCSLSVAYVPRRVMTPNPQSVLLGQFASVIRLCLGHFQLAEFSQLAQIICAFPCLNILIIDEARWGPGDSISPTLCPPHSLRALELRNCSADPILEWFLSFEKMPALQTVHFYGIRSVSLQTLNKFLRALGPSLEVFSYNAYTHNGRPISLGHNTCLRILRLELHRPSDITSITQILSQIVSTVIDEVHFMFFCHPTDDEVEEWDKADRILMQPPFSNLGKVVICFFDSQCRGRSAQEKANLKDWAVTHLPRCSPRGIISVCEDPRKRISL